MMNPLAAQEIFFDLSNTAGTADFLLGSRLVEDASYETSALSVSSVISDNSRAYFDFSHSQVIPFSEYSSSSGELGLQLRYLEIKDNQFFAGLHGFMNKYDETYSYYNSTGFGLYLKWKYYIKANQLVTSGYEVNMKKFTEIAEASNSEHAFFISYNQSFKTKTSLKLNSSLAIQDFWSQSILTGMGRNRSSVEISDIPSNSLITHDIRISQSLGPKLGLTLWLENQNLLNETADTLNFQDGLENPFTDRFRWEGPSSSLRFILRPNQKNNCHLSHSYVSKTYLNVPVYAFDFQTMDYVLDSESAMVNQGYDRKDERISIQFQWSRYWMMTRTIWLSDIDLVFGAGWTMNSSNDPLYDYESMNYSIGINFNN